MPTVRINLFLHDKQVEQLKEITRLCAEDHEWADPTDWRGYVEGIALVGISQRIEKLERGDFGKTDVILTERSKST